MNSTSFLAKPQRKPWGFGGDWGGGREQRRFCITDIFPMFPSQLCSFLAELPGQVLKL